MNSIETLKRDIERALPGVATKLRKPRKEDGHWWLDAKYNGHVVSVEWSPRRGFGISTDDPEDGYGEGPDEVSTERDQASKRVLELLVKGTRSVPPNDVLLRDLRAAVGFTQEQLATRLGVQQAAVSRLERRSDMTLSSLRRYVEALGGELEINVRTPDGERLRLLESRKKTNAGAACAHVSASFARSDVREVRIEHLLEVTTWLMQSARSRWPMVWSGDVQLRDEPSVDLAVACVERGTISLNTRALAHLTSMCASIAAVLPGAETPPEDAIYRYVLGHEIGHFVEPGARSSNCKNAEVHADLMAGYLAGLAGDEASAGSVVASLLGCRSQGCSYPTSEQRTFAFLSGHSRGTAERAYKTAKMKLLVLRVADLERSRAFYAELGLDLVPERHGKGPLHYSCNMQETVMELYPRAHDSQSAPLRFGFLSTRNALARSRDSGLLHQPPRLIRQTSNAEVYLLHDPDRNAIELEVCVA